MFTLAGEALTVNEGAPVIVSGMVILLVTLPEVPVTVAVALPAAAALVAFRVKVLLVVLVGGLKVPVTPVGRPLTEKLTVPVNPFNGVTAMVLFPLPPGAKERLVGVPESVKLGGVAMVKITVVLLVIAPDVPVTVTVYVPAEAF